METHWITLKEASKYSRYSVSYLWKLWSEGRLAFGGTRNKRLVNKEHLENQIAAGFPSLVVIEEIKPKTRRQKLTQLV